MLKEYIGRALRKISTRNGIGILDAFERLIQRKNKEISGKKLRVLIGPSFAIWAPSYALDRSISLALQSRGADVIPMYCDGIQDIECNYVGGDWGGKADFSKNCLNCKRTSARLWNINSNEPLLFSRYIDTEDVDKIDAELRGITFDDAVSYKKSEIEYGAMAKDIMVNNYLVATATLIDNHENLIKVHLRNLLMVSVVYERILDDIKPDRVVSNDSYYGMWAILQKHCIARSIPFYSHWPVTNDRAAFAYNDAAMNLDFTKSWPKFSMNGLTTEDEVLIEKWLKGERGLVIDTTKLAGHEIFDPVVKKIAPNKPTIVLAANVIWDLAALNKQVVFNDMVEWIIKTIDWFSDKPDLQMIIRPHPAETSPKIPNTRETVFEAIKLDGIKLPENVFLLKSDAKITLNELFSMCDVRGVAVHTTTVGFEYSAQGVPVVTTAKSPYRGFGFTIDPANKDEYFKALNELLSGVRKVVTQPDQLLARKFIKFYHFHYYFKHGLFSGNPPEISDKYMDILEGRLGAFAYVINAIVNGVPINGEDLWLPES